MKRLLCVLSGMNFGGAETFLMKLHRNLDRTRYQMDYCINSNVKQDYEDEIYGLGGQIIRVPCKSDDFAGFKHGLYNAVKGGGYEHVLRVTSNAMGFLDLKIAHEAGAKVCACRSSNAGGDESFRAMTSHLLGKMLYGKYVNRKIAPSDLAAMHTFGRRAYESGEVFMLRNALDLGYYKYDDVGRASIRRQLGLPNSAKVVGHIGRFQRQKNHEFLLRVFAELCKICNDVVLLLVGKGELEVEARKQVYELGISEKVVFAGVRKDIPQVLSAMDVLVMPSFFEGMPNVVIEAQATGLPCVVADTITTEANISGLVDYISLAAREEKWGTRIIERIKGERANTSDAFISAGYEIVSATRQFENYIFES